MGVIRRIGGKFFPRDRDAMHRLPFNGDLFHLRGIQRPDELRIRHRRCINGFFRADVIENSHQHQRDDHP